MKLNYEIILGALETEAITVLKRSEEYAKQNNSEAASTMRMRFHEIKEQIWIVKEMSK